MVAGQTKSELYSGNGEPDQELLLTNTPVIDGSVTITDDLDNEYTQVDDLVDSLPTDKHFTTELQPNSQTKLLFGDDSLGEAVPSGRVLTITYRIGGGLDTNVFPETVETQESIPDNLVITTVSNEERFLGGQDEQTTVSIRKAARAQYRQRRLLGRVEEVKDYAEAYAGVSRAYVVLLTNFSLFVTIIPEGGGSASPSLKTSLQDDINARLPMGYTAQVDDAALLTLTGDDAIEVEFTTNKGYDSAQLETLIAVDLATYLDPTATKTVNGRLVFLREFSETLRLNALRARLQAYVDSGAIDVDFEILSPLGDIVPTVGGIFTSTGSTITATSRNTRVVNYKV